MNHDFPAATPPTQLLKLKQVAERLAISSASVTSLITSGKLEAVNVSLSPVRKCWRVSEAAIEKFINGNTNKVAQPIRRGKRLQIEEFV